MENTLEGWTSVSEQPVPTDQPVHLSGGIFKDRVYVYWISEPDLNSPVLARFVSAGSSVDACNTSAFTITNDEFSAVTHWKRAVNKNLMIRQAGPSAPTETMCPKCTVLKDANVLYSNEIQGYVDPNRLSQGGLPSAPVERDERADFEADVNKRYPGTLLALSPSKARQGQYANLYVQSAWDAWQARAALDRKQ